MVFIYSEQGKGKYYSVGTGRGSQLESLFDIIEVAFGATQACLPVVFIVESVTANQ